VYVKVWRLADVAGRDEARATSCAQARLTRFEFNLALFEQFKLKILLQK
jgi:hypothetical protein